MTGGFLAVPRGTDSVDRLHTPRRALWRGKLHAITDAGRKLVANLVSSIVAVCYDGIPASQSQQGYDILRELSEHANKFIEMRALAEVTNESRQVMTGSSFAIANAMKMLHNLQSSSSSPGHR